MVSLLPCEIWPVACITLHFRQVVTWVALCETEIPGFSICLAGIEVSG